MADVGAKHCLVVVDAAQGPWLCELELPATATIAQAITQLRQRPDAPDADWAGAATGIWGSRRDRVVVPADGDRIEVYRPLVLDPRQRRRQLARGRSRG